MTDKSVKVYTDIFGDYNTENTSDKCQTTEASINVKLGIQLLYTTRITDSCQKISEIL